MSIDGSGGPPVKVVINNFTSRVYYAGSSDRTNPWLSGPLGYPDIAYRPRRWHTGVVGLSHYPFKLAVLKGQTGSLKATEGLDGWLYVNDTGTMRLLASELNFYPIVNNPITGRRDSLSNIVIAPVEQALFEPPGGVTVTWTDVPITRQPSQADAGLPAPQKK